MFERYQTAFDQQVKPRCSELMLRFSGKDIDRLERDGKSRSDTSHAPKPHSSPQKLRTLGWLIDNKEGRLLKIFMRGHSVRVYTQQFPAVKGWKHYR